MLIEFIVLITGYIVLAAGAIYGIDVYVEMRNRQAKEWYEERIKPDTRRKQRGSLHQ